MAYGIEGVNNPVLFGVGENDQTQQLDLLWFADGTQGQSTVPFILDGGQYYVTTANGGSVGTNTNLLSNSFGYTACSGVFSLVTGTTNNATGYASAASTSNLIPGLPTPPSGFVTRYEYETAIRTTASIHSNTVRGAFRLGFQDSSTNTAPVRGVYFEFLCNGTITDTTWKVVIASSSGSTRIDTGMTASATTTYRMYLSTNVSATGGYTTNYNIKNMTNGFSVVGTATPSATSHYPTATTDYLASAAVNTKAVTATTLSISNNVDYIGTRIRRPITREILIMPAP